LPFSSSMSVNESNLLYFKLPLTLLPYVTVCIFAKKGLVYSNVRTLWQKVLKCARNLNKAWVSSFIF